jgi:hypothetical protein
MGKALKALPGVKLLEGLKPKKINPQIADKSLFDISQEVKPAQEAYAPLLQQSQAQQQAVAPLQTQALQQLGMAATGQGPSLAEVQMKAAQDRNLSQQLAAIQASRGGSAAANQRALLQGMGQSGRDIAQQAGIARLQERDQFLNQANIASQNLRTDIGGKLNLDLMPKQNLQNWEMSRVGSVNQAQAANAAARNQLTGSLIGGAASIAGAALSDKKEKKDIKAADKDMKQFLDALTASNYEYKDTSKPGTAKGERYGVMAQDLEKTKVGASMVEDTPKGKQVNYGQALGAILASQAALNKRLEKMESGPKKSKKKDA